MDRQTRKFLRALRAIVAAPDHQRRQWLQQLDRLLATSTAKKKAT
jgi:hypothetical protein